MKPATAFYERAAYSSALTGLLLLILLPAFTAPPSLLTAGLLLIATGVACEAAQSLTRNGPSVGQSPFFWATLALVVMSHAVHPPVIGGVERSFIWVACAAGGLVVGRSARNGTTARALLIILVILTVRGCAERLYLFDVLRAAAGEYEPSADTPGFAAFLQSDRARATFGQANGFAGFLIILLPLSCGMVKAGKGLPRFLPLLFTAAALGASGSKGGLLAAIWTGGIVARALLYRRTAVALLGLGAFGTLICAAGLLAPGLVPDTLDSALTTLRLRLDYWRTAADMSTSHAWGVGPGLFGETYTLHAEESAAFSRYAHNGYLGLVAEFGLIGIAFIIVSAFLLLREPGLPGKPHAPRRPWEVYFALPVACSTTGLDLVPGGGFLLNAAVIVSLAAWTDRLLRDAAGCVAGNLKQNRSLARAACAGFLIHSLVDFDVHITSVTATLALACAPLCAAARPAHRTVAGATLLLSLAAALAWVLVALPVRQAAHGVESPFPLAEGPADLRLLYRTADRDDLTLEERTKLRAAFLRWEPQLGHLPEFRRRLVALH